MTRIGIYKSIGEHFYVRCIWNHLIHSRNKIYEFNHTKTGNANPAIKYPWMFTRDTDT